MSDPQVDVPIAIIGGGIGGLALAVSLTRRNVPFRIYEAVSKFSEIGAGIACSTNAVRALGLISPELLRGFNECVTQNAFESYRNTWFAFRYGQDPRNKSGKNIHRARLLEELVKLIPPDVTEFNKCLSSISEDSTNNTILLHFSDGTTICAQAVIGADGIKSKTRDFVCQKTVHPNYCSEYAYRALIPRDAAIAILGEELATNGQIYCGYGTYIVSYPIENGALVNIVGVIQKQGSTWPGTGWLQQSTKEAMLKDLEGWHPGLMELFDKYSKCEQWALHDMLHPYPYARGQACLLGDSAHATTPHQGAGGGMAMEDAFILGNLLSDFRDPKDYEAVFKAYDEVRRPRTQSLIVSGHEAGGLISFMGKGVGDDMDKFEDAVREGYFWIWHFDLEGDLERA
ncbi:FAD/NAD(P)-binding domain-containing protein, partial [Pseudovirgaria hyperparasitica]